MNVMEESQSCWQAEARDPSPVTGEGWRPGRWKTENLELPELSTTMLEWSIAEKLRYRKIKF